MDNPLRYVYTVQRYVSMNPPYGAVGTQSPIGPIPIEVCTVGVDSANLSRYSCICVSV